MIHCSKCDFSYDEKTAILGGLCPRCLLLGTHEGRADSLRQSDDPSEPLESLADDELAAELPGFDLVEHLGRGGAGVVWKATERVLNRHVAIKLLHNVKKDMGFFERFSREARIMAHLSHPNIVTLFTFGRTRSNHCYLVMEMVEGKDLGNLLSSGPLELTEALTIMHDVCVAIHHAHEAGFMHRDIKPGNVLIDRRGRVKVADFGLARLTSENGTTTITRRGWAVGTPHYIAPEQARGEGEEDHRADIYSIGVMFYQMLTGELPRGVFSPPSKKRTLDKRLDKIVLRALQEAPEKRYQSVAEMMSDLQKVREKVDPGLQAEQKAARHATRWRLRFEMGLAIALSLVFGIMIADYFRKWLEPISMSTELPQIDGGIVVNERGSFPRMAGLVISKEIRLQPPTLSNGSLFGRSLAVDGDWLAVGAPDDLSQSATDAGCVYLYRRGTNHKWVLWQVLTNPHRGDGARFGYAIALQGGRLAVGSPREGSAPGSRGSVDLYEMGPSAMWMRARVESFPPVHSQALGLKVMLWGDRMAVLNVAEPLADTKSTASMMVITRDAVENKWGQADRVAVQFPTCAVLTEGGELICGQSDFPGSLYAARWESNSRMTEIGRIPLASALNGDVQTCTSLAANADLLLAASSGGVRSMGAVWVLRRDSAGTFTSESQLQPPPGFGPDAGFGKSIALHPEQIAVGIPYHAAEGPTRGAVAVYRHGADGRWKQAGIIQPAPAGGAMGFGESVAVTPELIVAGAPQSSRPGSAGDGGGVGAVYVYEVSPQH